MTYQTAVFDLDGTLLNTLEDLADAVNYSLKKNKMPLCTITQVCQYVGNGIVKLMERAVPSGKDNPVFEQALSDFKEYYAEHCTVSGGSCASSKFKEKGCENGGCIK